MSSLVDSREAQISVLSDLTSHVRGIGPDAGIPGSIELFLVRIWDSKGHGFTANPIAGKVAIAVHEGNLDAIFEEIGKVF